MDINDELKDKFTKLIKIIESYESVCVAYSAGVDSTLLSYIINNFFKKNPLIITANSVFLSKYEQNEAVKIAKMLGFNHKIVDIDILNNQKIKNNCILRCKYCKKHIMTSIIEYTKKQNLTYIIDGSNIDDLDDYRPGFEAIKELGIKSPFIEANINKQDIRKMADHFKLPNKDKPASACLASRIPYNTAITMEILERVEKSEDFIRYLGYSGFRVRHHDKIAKIELIPEDINNFIINHREKVDKALKQLGYTNVCIDLKGYTPAGLKI
jgi:uncharacterized protein